MAYVTYQFYKENYMGSAVGESDFVRYEMAAERVVNHYTYHRIAKNGLPTSEYESNCVLTCVCRLIDAISGIEGYKEATKVSENGRSNLVKSVSAGSESIAYATTEGMYAQGAKDNGKTLYRSIVFECLTGIAGDDGICLLYGGV